MNEMTGASEDFVRADTVARSYDENSEAHGTWAPQAVERLMAAVINHRNWVIGSIAVALLIGLLATFLATPQFTSTSRIEILSDAPVATTVEGASEVSPINEISFYNTQYSLLQSRSLAERVMRAGNLATDQQFLEAFNLDAPDAGMTSAERRDQANQVIAILLDRVQVSPVRQSSLVDISFSTPSPALSAKLADLWVTQFVQATIDRRFAATSDARKYLESRLDALRQNLETSERALISYATGKGIVTISSETDAQGRTQTQTLVASDIAATSKSLAAAREQRVAAEADLAGTLTGNAQIVAPTVGRLREQRATVEAELARLRTLFQDDYPAVISLRAQLVNLDKSIKAETSRSSQSNREAYDAAVKRERDLQAELDGLTGQYNVQQRDSIQMAILQREVDSNRQLYDGLLQRYKEIGASGVGTNNISVVDRAKVPERPSSPNLMLNMALALLAGIGLAAGLVFMLEKMDSSIRDPQDVAPRFGLPLLGAIPEVRGQALADVIVDKKSSIYEAYVSLMTNLSFLTAHGAPRSIMVTSSRPQEGKSSSSLCLATVLAGTGKSVILVDADVRNPSLNRYLDIANKRGLSHYLSGDDALPELITTLPKFGFDIVTAGVTPPNAAELLGSERFKVLIETLLARYDHVIIDSAPLLGLADAPLIARRVEGVLFTIEANSTKSRVVGTALNRLRMSGAKLFGAIVTKVGAKNQVYGYGYEYGYSYGRDQDKADA